MISRKEIKQKALDFKDRQRDEVLNRVRAKYVKRWMEISECDRMEDIDMTNPFIIIEFNLCNPYWLQKIKSEAGREEFFNLIGDEAKDIYLNYRDENGESYRSLEHNQIKNAVKNKLKRSKKEEIKDDTTDEEKEYIKEMENLQKG